MTLPEISQLRSQVVTLEQLLEVHELTVIEQSDRLEQTLRQLRERSEELEREIAERERAQELAAAYRELEQAQAASLNIMEDLARQKHALEQAYQKIQQKTEELARSNQELEQFAYVASHDLQEPLRKMINYAQLVARRYHGQLEADADRFLAYIVEGALRMQALIHDLLTYSRVGREMVVEPTDLAAVLQQVLSDLGVKIQESGAVVTADPLPTVLAHPTHMAQLLQNLLSNAVKFRGKEPPRVHVSVVRRQDEWVVSVRDHGIGIDPQYHERIFVIFQRLHTRQEYPGTGIGLAICKKIVERHGGRIWVDSVSGQGATFSLTIPAADQGGSHGG